MGANIIALPRERAAKLRGVYAGSSLATQVIQRMGQLSCWMHLLAHHEPHRLSLRCGWCGYETAGWDIEPRRGRPSSCSRELSESSRAIRECVGSFGSERTAALERAFDAVTTVRTADERAFLHQRGKDAIADIWSQSEQTTCLIPGQAQAWHFAEFPKDPHEQ
jgi:hypothetical protein